MATTRYHCPLECGWHLDQGDLDFSNPATGHPFVERDWPEGVDPIVAGLVAGELEVVEQTVKAHLETHTLLDWAEGVHRLRRRAEEAEARAEAAPDGPHRYLSTGCRHGAQTLPDGRTGHEYCQGETGTLGAKTPAQCKFCAAPCICDCHPRRA